MFRRQLSFIFAALVLLCCLSWLLACDNGSNDNGGPQLDAASISSKAISSTNALTSFHFTLVVEGQTAAGSQLVVNKGEGDFAKPNLVSAKINVRYAGSPAQVSYISAGEQKQYILIFGCWQSFNTLALNPSQAASDILANIKSLKLTGQDSNEANSYHLTGQISADQLKALTSEANSGANLNAELWIDKDSFQVRRALLLGPINKTDDPSKSRYDIRLTDYGKQVSIAAPAAETICKSK